MKNIFKIMITVLVGSLFILTACEEDESATKPFDPNDQSLGTIFVLGAPNKTVVVDTETATTTFTIGVRVWGALPNTDVTIPVIIETEGTTLPSEAITVVGGSVTVESGTNNAVLTVQLHRDEITPGVIFYVKYKLGEPTSGEVYEPNASGTITTFNPGPLAPWVGNFSAYAFSYGSPGNWDEEWNNIAIELDPADPLNNIRIKGIAGSNSFLIATIDVDAETITIQPGQDIGAVYGYGPTIVHLGDPDPFTKIPGPLTGTVDPDTGEIFVDNWLHELPDFGGYVWDIFEVTFTKKTKKKSAVIESVIPESKKARIE
jgi:hypothetical protein